MTELNPLFSWTLFLDCDGVINKRNQNRYIASVEEFLFLPFVLEGLKRLLKQFSKIIIVSNQQGVDKGIMSMVGDTDSDIRFGMNLGMKTVLIKSEEKIMVEPNIIVSNLKELANAFNH